MNGAQIFTLAAMAAYATGHWITGTVAVVLVVVVAVFGE